MRVQDKYEQKESFAKQARDATWAYFEPRIKNCENKAWLREAVKLEAEGEARTKRIKLINQRIQEL